MASCDNVYSDYTAIYGGTFAPPHLGHIRAAETLLSEVSPRELYVIPTAIPPHKRVDFIDSPEARLEMLKIAFEDSPEWGKRLFVSDYEVRKSGVSYTVETLEYFSKNINDRLIFLCGGDMFDTLSEWFRAERIFELAVIAYVRRSESDALERSAERFRREYGARLIGLRMDTVDISSTALRKKLADGDGTGDYITPEVLRYIKKNGLFGTAKV